MADTYPIVFVHGIARFDGVTNMLLSIDNDPARDDLHYFRGVRTMLMKNGFRAHHAEDVPWAASVRERSEALRKAVQDHLKKTKAQRVNIVAHSMGGLDARHMMFNDRRKGRIHERIASLTTISTPHGGSPVADALLEKLPGLVEIGNKLGLDIAGLNDLTVHSCAAFNNDPEVTAFEQKLAKTVQFRTIAGSTGFLEAINILKLPFALILQKEGANDGLASVQSAKWRGRPHYVVLPQTDHLNELGWWDLAQIFTESERVLRKRIHVFYLTLARQLPGK